MIKAVKLATQYWIAIAIFVLSSCANKGVRFDAQEQSLSDIRQAIVHVIGKPRLSSQSLREFWSEYFPKREDKNFDPLKSKERFYTVVTIYNDARPYLVQVEVIREQKSGGQFVESGLNDEMSTIKAQEIYKRLNEGRGRRNVIDDFRAF